MAVKPRRKGEGAVFQEFYKDELVPEARKPGLVRFPRKHLDSEERRRASLWAAIVPTEAWRAVLNEALDFCDQIGMLRVKPSEGDRELLAASSATSAVLEFLQRIHSAVDNYNNVSTDEEEKK